MKVIQLILSKESVDCFDLDYIGETTYNPVPCQPNHYLNITHFKGRLRKILGHLPGKTYIFNCLGDERTSLHGNNIKRGSLRNLYYIENRV